MQIISKNLSELKPHPVNEQIYTGENLAESFIDSIKLHGQLTPINVSKDNYIISGHRRVQALIALGYKTVLATEKEYQSPEDQILDLIESNNCRQKTKVEQLNEIKHYRANIGKGQGQRTDLADQSLFSGSTRDYIAEKMQISSTNINKLELIHRVEPELLKSIDRGEATIHSAYKDAQKIAKEREEPNEVIDASTNCIETPKLSKTKTTELTQDGLTKILMSVEESSAKFCQCPVCDSILDIIELIKNHKYENEND